MQYLNPFIVCLINISSTLRTLRNWLAIDCVMDRVMHVVGGAQYLNELAYIHTNSIRHKHRRRGRALFPLCQKLDNSKTWCDG